MEQKKILGLGAKSAIAIVVVAMLLAYGSSLIVDKALDDRYEDGYEKGAQEVFTMMVQSASPACSILTVSDESIDRPLRYIDVDCLTEA